MTTRTPAQEERARLRREVRRARRALRGEQKAAADRAICRRIQTLGAYRKARSIAVYLAFDGEPSLKALADAAARHGKQLFAPVLLREGMRFARLASGAAMGRNMFGIDEPSPDRLVDARMLDLVLTPLVAFDSRGARLGMGRGYYDRAFHFLRHRRHWSRPKLVGIGYSFQHVPHLELQAWDIPLWAAVTEAQIHRFSRGES